MNQRPAVVMLTVGVPPEHYGGAEQQCLRLSKALQDFGTDVVIVAASHAADLPSHDVVEGVRVVRIVTRRPPDHGGLHMTSSMKWTFAVLTWLWRHRRQVRLVHVHQGKFHMLPALLAEVMLGTPFIVKVGNAEEQFDYLRLANKTGGYGRLVMRWVKKRARWHVAISSRIAEQMVTIGVPQSRIRQIPNGIDIGRFRFDDGADMGDGRTFAYYGRLSDEKQPMMMLRCFARILDTGRNHQLIVAGDGPLLDTMRTYVRDNGLDDRITFLGRIDDVAPLLARSHFFVLPSKNEGLSNALLEAMSSGLVAIASQVSGSTDAIRHGESGLLFPRDDEAAFVRCLRSAADMPAAEWQAMRRAARRDIERHYVMANIARAYVNLYETMGPSGSSDDGAPGGP